MPFPEDFVWGAATSSYQIEGAPWRAGGGASVWDRFCDQPGKIAGGDTGEFACDHVNRYREDVELMTQLGLRAYRFSVSWPRVLPDGIGRVNARGLDFYDRLVDALLARGIAPWLTLFHWDFPSALFDRGGWLNRDSADWFAEYTTLIVDRLSDRVRHWSTLNEPQIYLGLGHLDGVHAPGLKLDIAQGLLAAHHSLLAHGRAVQVIRARAIATPVVGAVHAGFFSLPDRNENCDIVAARESSFALREKNFFNNSWCSDPMILGAYPADGVELFAGELPRIADGDLETICQPLDYFGANIYWGSYLRAGTDGGADVVTREGQTYTELGWPVTPEVMYWGPKFYAERYGLPLVVTENGLACAGTRIGDRIDDAARIDFHRRYLRQLARAIDDGIDCRGYFVWSLLDNFEWAEGYAKRFGMIHVDFETGQRSLKDSARWYRRVIDDNTSAADNPRRPSRADAEEKIMHGQESKRRPVAPGREEFR